MFKKYYKEAVDDIKPDRALIGKIFDEAEKKTNPKTAVIYRYGMAFAAVLVLAVSAYSYPKITEYAKVDRNETIDVESITAGEKDSTPKYLSEDTSDVKNEKQTIEKEQIQNVPLKGAVEKSDTFDTAEIFKTNDAVDSADLAMTVQEETVEAMPAQPESVNDVAETEKISGGGGGGGASAAKHRSVETALWSMSSYTDYLGINIEETARVPSDMRNMTPDTVYVAMGENGVENDLMTFCFSGDGRNVLIETAKKADVFFNADAGCSEEIFGSVTVKVSRLSENEFDAYFEHMAVKFRIYSSGLSENEFKDIVQSIALSK